MSEQIGFIGLGNMGSQIAANLLKNGYQVTVYNRTAAKAEPLVAQGAQRATHPSEVITSGGIVITMVANDKALESVVHAEGFLTKLGNGLHISISTVAPTTARSLSALHSKHGSTFISAPVFGRPEAAAAQKLVVCVAGPAAAKERALPILRSIGQSVFDFGEEAAMANVVKVCGNFMIAAAMESMAEAMTLVEKNQIDRSAFISMLSQTIFAAPIYQNYGKMIAEKRHTPAGFELVLGLKDINLVLDTAEQSKMPMPFASLLHDRFMASIAKGRGDIDWSGIALGVSEDAGM